MKARLLAVGAPPAGDQQAFGPPLERARDQGAAAVGASLERAQQLAPAAARVLRWAQELAPVVVGLDREEEVWALGDLDGRRKGYPDPSPKATASHRRAATISGQDWRTVRCLEVAGALA